MLLCGIVNKLKKETTKLCSNFCCEATNSRTNNATAVLRSLIYLLVNQPPSLILHVRKKYDFEDVNA